VHTLFWRGRLAGVVFAARSRFLEFPIQIAVAESVHLRGTRPAHAPTHNDVGGYMKGERKEKEKGKRGASQGALRVVRLGLIKP
jgi:hypothetical protein